MSFLDEIKKMADTNIKPRNLFLESLRSMLNHRFPGMKQLYPLNELPQDVKFLKTQIYCIKTALAESVEYYSRPEFSADTELLTAISDYQRALAALQDYSLSLENHCANLIQKVDRKSLSDCIIDGRITTLRAYLKYLGNTKESKVLRGDAVRCSIICDSPACLDVFVREAPQSLLQPNTQDGRIALHVAIDMGDNLAVQRLLSGVDTERHDMYYQQLNFKDFNQQTPLDLLEAYTDPAEQKAMIMSILKIAQDYKDPETIQRLQLQLELEQQAGSMSLFWLR